MKLLILFLFLASLSGFIKLISPNGPGPYPCVRLVKDINPVGDGLHFATSFGTDYDVPLRSTIEFNGNMYFGATSGTSSGVQLWKTDGSETGTIKVKTIYPPVKPGFPGGDSNPDGFLIAGQTLFFVASSHSFGREIWKTDGTSAGTVLLKDIQPDNDMHDPPTFLRNVNGSILFAANDRSGNFHELWRSDGTPGGTVKLKDAGTQNVGRIDVSCQALVHNQVYYFARINDGLWRSDGTSAGTYRVKKINSSGNAAISNLCVVDGQLLFRADDGVHGLEIWKSDGTDAGTTMVKELFPGRKPYPFSLFSLGSTLLFWTANTDSPNWPNVAWTLWKSNGTAAGTVAILVFPAINISGLYPSRDVFMPAEFTLMNDMMFFSMGSPIHGKELWKTDGTTAGTVMVKNINTVSDQELYPNRGSYPREFMEAGGKLYFSATDGLHGRELWVTDGTTTGTKLVKDLNPNGDALPTRLTELGSKLLFGAFDGTHGWETFSYGMCNFHPITTEELPPNEVSKSTGLQLRVLGNPARQTITAEVEAETGQTIALVLTDLNGRILEKKKINVKHPSERQTFDVSSLGGTVLLLRAATDREARTIRVVVTN